MRKKLLATLLAVVLILGLIPLSSFGKGVAYAESAPPRITSFTIKNGTQLIDKKSSAVVGTVNGVEVIQKAVKKTYNDDYEMDLYYLGDITIYYTADADISATAKIGGIQSEFAKNGYPDALWNADYSEIEIYPDRASNVMIMSDEYASTIFTYKLTAVRGSADDADTTAPTLTAGGVTRVSESEATVYFRADEAGEYYYAYGDLGSEIEVDTSQHSTSMDEGENTLTISGLASGAKILHIIAKDTSGNTMEEPLEIIIPAYNQEIGRAHV